VPIIKVSRFQDCLVQARLHQKLKIESKYKVWGRLAILGALAFMAWSGLALQHAIVTEEDKSFAAVEEAKEKLGARIDSIQALGQLPLAAFPQSDPSPADAAVRASEKKKSKVRKRTKKPQRRVKSKEPTMVASCERSQKSIINGIRKHFKRINTCIANEQKRSGKNSLGSTLVVAFVVRPTGSVLEFEIQDRVVAQTGLKNCLTRVFRGMRFPRVGGTNCPITLPIKLKTN